MFKPRVLGVLDHEIIYRRFLNGDKYDKLSKCYGVSPGAIKRIIDGMKMVSSPSAHEIDSALNTESEKAKNN